MTQNQANTFFSTEKKPKPCCHLPMSLTFNLSLLGASNIVAGIYMVSKTLAAGLIFSNPIFLIGAGLIAAGILLTLGIWQLYLWQSKNTNADYEPESPANNSIANNPTP